MAQFLTDFGANALGAGIPTGWTRDTGNVTGRLAASSLKQFKAELTYGTGSTASDLYLNAPGSNANQEILMLYKTPSASANFTFIMSLGRMQSAAISGYIVGAVDNGAGTRSFVTSSVNAGTSTTLGTHTGKTWSYGDYWWSRLRCNGTTIQGKVWLYGTAEPSSYDVTATNSTWTTGNSGIRLSTSAGTGGATVYFSVGTAGDIAPWVPTRIPTLPMAGF